MQGEPHRLHFEPTANGQRLTLPRRRIGKSIVFTTVFGLLFAGIPGYFLGSSALEMFRQEDAWRWTALLPALFALPFVLIGLGVGLGPWVSLLARTTLRIEGDELIVRDHVAFLGWTRRRRIDDLKGFRVDVGSSSVNDGPRKPMKNFATLSGDCGEGVMPFTLAVGYPRDVVNAAAELLADRLETRGRLGAERELTVTEHISEFKDTDEADGPEDTPETIPPQPVKSKITIEQRPDGVSYYLPPRGVWKGSRGLMLFAILWNGFVAVFVGVFILSPGEVTYEGSDAPVPWYVFWPFMSIFIVIGLGVLLGALRSGKRRAIIDVSQTNAGPALLVAEETFLSKKTHDLPPGGVCALHVGPSGVEVNDKPVYHLIVELTEEAAAAAPKRKQTRGFFSEREDDELRWLAARLRRDLGVGKRRPNA